jgi:hypothetical protein
MAVTGVSEDAGRDRPGRGEKRSENNQVFRKMYLLPSSGEMAAKH